MKVGVTGSRNFANKTLLAQTLDRLEPTQIISGGAPGADTLAYRYAMNRGIVFLGYPPSKEDKEQWGFARAAKRRNMRIADACEVLVAFPLDDSKGTWHTVGLAKKLGKEVKVVHE